MGTFVGRGRRPRTRARAAGLIAVLSATSLVVSASARAQEDDPPDLTTTSLTPDERLTAGKSLTSSLAETDPALLGRTDATPVEVVVKLDYDAIATYQGSIEGLDATSPTVTGEKLDATSDAVQDYESFVVDKENAFLDQLAAVVPEAQVGQSLRTVYGGVALTIPANSVDAVLAIPEVVAVQTDSLNQLTTDSSGEWIGADSIYADLGTTSDAGEGIIFGVLDSGAWPEHPSFADQGNLGAPPPKADGTPRTCDFGDNPLTPAIDVFVCNNKLIGGQPFLDTYLMDPDRPDEPYPDTARDSNGHGTHTGSTAAGNALDSATVFGVERGPIAGIAPGAWVSVYKVCGVQGCTDSDSAAAVGQAIKDGVDVINFSISGGTDPFTDPVELAFLDAYAAGVFVSTSGGNDGPGASTVNHVSPWTTTVAASTQQREFRSTLSLTAGNGDTFTADGASITAGAGPLPVVLSSAAPYSNPLCDAPAPPGSFTGKIVACQRGVVGRVEKGFNVNEGGAAGMILYNPTLADVETDNHWLPTVHLADGTAFVAFMGSHTGVTGTFTAGQKADGVGDVLAAFSSKGPAGNFIKPDITAPGVQILAGHTPTPESIVEGPEGEYFQAIAGTSMSSPHIAGSAILLASLNPELSPGQIKSALMTTANWADQKKEDGVTPAGPFDVGSGRVELNFAPDAGLAISATAAEFAQSANDPNAAIDLNVPSVYVPRLAGSITTTRVVTNVTDRRVRYDVSTLAGQPGTSITVSPRRINLAPGDSAELSITIATGETSGDFDGLIFLEPRTSGLAQQHLTVAFTAAQGDVTLMQECVPDTIIVQAETSECTVTAQNETAVDTTVDLTTTLGRELRVAGVDGTNQTSNRSTHVEVDLAGEQPGVPSIAPGDSPGGYMPLADFGTTAIPVGDEEILNFDVPPFEYNGVTYDRIGVDTNGYIIVGGGVSTDNNCCNLPAGPDAAPPNNVLAPFWTDLDGTADQGIFAEVLAAGPAGPAWIVIEWQVDVFGTNSNRHFQVWIGVNGTQDISFTYDPAALPANPGMDFLVGAENEDGDGEISETLPTEDLVVTSTDPVPGGKATYTVTARGRQVGFPVVQTAMTTPVVAGTTIVEDVISVIEAP